MLMDRVGNDVAKLLVVVRSRAVNNFDCLRKRWSVPRRLHSFSKPDMLIIKELI